MSLSTQLWTILTAFPTQLSRDFAEQRKLQQEFLKCRRDLNATSSQDEFAKWAKLRRHHDKLLDQLEKKSTEPYIFFFSLSPHFISLLTRLCPRGGARCIAGLV